MRGRYHATALSSFLAALLAVAAPEGNAAPPTPSDAETLAWTSPSGCPDARAVRGAIETLLGDSLDAPRAVAVSAAATVRATDNRAWVLELTVTTSTGSRTRLYSARTCSELADLAAVLIAVAIDPTVDPGTLPTLDPRAPDVPEPPTFPEPPPTQAPAPTVTRTQPPKTTPADKRRDLQGVLRAATGVSIGPLPTAAPGVHLSAGLRGRWFRAEVLGGYWFGRGARFSEQPEVGGNIRAWALGLRGCGVPRFGLVELPVCAAVEAGAMRGAGIGAARTRARRLLWAAARTGIGLWVVPIRQFGLGIDADLVVPLTRPGFEIDGLGELHRAAPVGFFGLFGVEARFP